MKSLSFKVKQGIIHINTITLLQKTEEVLVFSVDCKQKYAEFAYVDGNNRVFSMRANEETLKVEDKEAENTEIELVGWQEEEDLFDNYHIFSRMGRYSLTIALIKNKKNREDVWTDD